MDLCRQSLFEIPMWIAQLDEVVPHHRFMIQQLEQLLEQEASERHDHQKYLAHQTASDPFALPGEGWELLSSTMNSAFAELAKRHFQRWRNGEFHVRRWAIRLGRLNDEEKMALARDSVHNHLPALFSSIYYLSVPTEMADKPSGGTMFINPIGNLMDVISTRTKVIAPKEGRLVIFPSFVDHTPLPITWDAPSSCSRIVISCDVFYVSGEAETHSSASVVPIRNG